MQDRPNLPMLGRTQACAANPTSIVWGINYAVSYNNLITFGLLHTLHGSTGCMAQVYVPRDPWLAWAPSNLPAMWIYILDHTILQIVRCTHRYVSFFPTLLFLFFIFLPSNFLLFFSIFYLFSSYVYFYSSILLFRIGFLLFLFFLHPILCN
jgi:hypothetical protein